MQQFNMIQENTTNVSINSQSNNNIVITENKIELNINAEPIDYLLLFVTGYLVIILALIVPSVNVMRYQPKEILAGKE